MPGAFACPPDCGWCCTHLERAVPREEAKATRAFQAMLREEGVYACGDAASRGLSLSNAEAAALRAEAGRRGLRVRLHPRTFLLETRRRLAVALDWHLDHAACPFHADFRCTAYDARPLVCRAYPVLMGAPRWTLAPECPRAAPALEARARGEVRFGAFLRTEAAARRRVEERHAALDEAWMRLLATPGARFAKGLPAREALARLRRSRVVSPEEFEACTAPARSSTN